MQAVAATLAGSIMSKTIRCAIWGLLTAAGLAASSGAQTISNPAGRCAGLPSFGSTDSLNQADLQVENKDLRVRVSERGPELRLRLEPDPGWKSATANAIQRTGWIRIFSCDTGALLQSLEAESMGDPEHFLRLFEVKDVNFDGYLDLAVLREYGAKWGSQTWWVFSPVSGTFISNDFTKALGQVSANGLTLDAGRHDIIAPHLTTLTGCGGTQDIYHVEDGRLELIHKEDTHVGPDGCTLTARDRVNGQMQVTKVQQFPSSHNTAAHQ